MSIVVIFFPVFFSFCEQRENNGNENRKKVIRFVFFLHSMNFGHRAVYNWVSKVISELLWFMITSLSNWFNVLAPFFQPIRSETKTNRGLRLHIFPRSVSATCNSSFDWFTRLSPSFLIGQRNYFGFGFTTLIWKPLYAKKCPWLDKRGFQ